MKKEEDRISESTQHLRVQGYDSLQLHGYCIFALSLLGYHNLEKCLLFVIKHNIIRILHTKVQDIKYKLYKAIIKCHMFLQVKLIPCQPFQA